MYSRFDPCSTSKVGVLSHACRRTPAGARSASAGLIALACSPRLRRQSVPTFVSLKPRRFVGREHRIPDPDLTGCDDLPEHAERQALLGADVPAVLLDVVQGRKIHDAGVRISCGHGASPHKAIDRDACGADTNRLTAPR